MNKTVKILVILVGILIISNIAILFFLFAHRPPMPDTFDARIERFPENLHQKRDFFLQLKKSRHDLIQINTPVIMKIRQFDKLIYEELLQENPDESKLNSYLDSLQQYNQKIKHSTVRYFLENKDSLTFEQKRFLLQNLLEKHVHQPRHRHNKRMKGPGR